MQNILFFVRKYIKDVLLFVLVLISICLTLFNIFYYEENDSVNYFEPTIENDVNDDEIVQISTKVNVDVKGAIKKPGVYKVEEGTIINDVINMAGGFNSNAYKNGINLSKKVSDEMVLYVYTKAEIEKNETTLSEENSTIDNNNSCKVPDYVICECTEDNKSIIESGANISSDNNSILININTASINELTNLSGIGESKAKAIIEYHEKNGLYTKIDDLLNVSGIGDSLFAKIKNYITI